jgi:hypothetical protein
MAEVGKLMMNGSVYNYLAPQYIAKGLTPLPIGPGKKYPQVIGPNGFRDLPEWTTCKPITSLQPGAGIGLRMGNGICAIDMDNDEVAITLMDILPATPARKVGQRAETWFYRAPVGLASRKFLINKCAVVELLAEGSQTVIPDTIHPDTGKPYRWLGLSLAETPLESLPMIPGDIVQQIEAVLVPFGYEPKPEYPKPAEDGEESPFQELNNLAFGNLPAWVPELGLYKCTRKRGRYPAYEAVATWRPSTMGRALEQRELNLKISSKGIKDWGTGEGYSPINLVMRVRDCERSDAVDWLQERVCPKGPEIDFEALAAAADEAPSKAEGANGKDPGGSESAGDAQAASAEKGLKRGIRFKLIPYNQMHLSEEESYVVEDVIPAKGIVLLWGPRKTLKTFFMLSAALHIAKGWEFCGKEVKQGTVVYLAFEGGHGTAKRVTAQRKHFGIADDERVPLLTLIGSASLIHDHKQLVADISAELVFHEYSRPAVVVVDTLNRSFVGAESKDADMTAYVNAAAAIRNAFDCVVVIVHHCGWDETHSRGHTALPSAMDAELSIKRTNDVAVVTVNYAREGPEGVELACRAIPVPVEADIRGRERSSLVLVPAGEDVPIGGRKGEPEHELSETQALALSILNRCMRQHGRPLPHGLDAAGLDGVLLNEWRNALVAAHTLEKEDRKKWSRLLNGLQARNEIRIHDPWVWVPLT